MSHDRVVPRACRRLCAPVGPRASVSMPGVEDRTVPPCSLVPDLRRVAARPWTLQSHETTLPPIACSPNTTCRRARRRPGATRAQPRRARDASPAPACRGDGAPGGGRGDGGASARRRPRRSCRPAVPGRHMIESWSLTRVKSRRAASCDSTSSRGGVTPSRMVEWRCRSAEDQRPPRPSDLPPTARDLVGR